MKMTDDNLDDIVVDTNNVLEEDLFAALNESLKMQVEEELKQERAEKKNKIASSDDDNCPVNNNSADCISTAESDVSSDSNVVDGSEVMNESFTEDNTENMLSEDDSVSTANKETTEEIDEANESTDAEPESANSDNTVADNNSPEFTYNPDEDDNEDGEYGEDEEPMKKRKKSKVLKIIGIIFLCIIILVAFFAGPGRKYTYKFIGWFISSSMNKPGDEEPDSLIDITPVPGINETPEEIDDPDDVIIDITPIPNESETIRTESYVKNVLLFGIDQGSMDSVHSSSLNTDSMMIATINTKDKTVKLTSILRDTYVELSDGRGRKLNSVYAIGRKNSQGPELLINTLENLFKINIDGYAFVKLSSFESIVDRLDGIDIELTKGEANYLNTTNYITKEKYRNLHSGMNHLNGNQVVGYCRVRKVATLGGANNDFGRTLRQRRVLNAIFDKYKSKNVFELLSITQDCLGYITTDLSGDLIAEMLSMVVDNGISTMESYRLPIEDSYYDSGLKGYNGITYGVVITDQKANVEYLYQHLYADTEEEAKENAERIINASKTE